MITANQKLLRLKTTGKKIQKKSTEQQEIHPGMYFLDKASDHLAEIAKEKNITDEEMIKRWANNISKDVFHGDEGCLNEIYIATLAKTGLTSCRILGQDEVNTMVKKCCPCHGDGSKINMDYKILGKVPIEREREAIADAAKHGFFLPPLDDNAILIEFENIDGEITDTIWSDPSESLIFGIYEFHPR